MNDKDIRILSALSRHPLENATVMSRRTGMALTTFSKRLRKLYESRVLLSISAQVN